MGMHLSTLTIYVLLCCDINYLFLFLICNHLSDDEKAGCFAFLVFLLSCNCLFSVSHPKGSIGLSAACNCGLPSSYSHDFKENEK